MGVRAAHAAQVAAVHRGRHEDARSHDAARGRGVAGVDVRARIPRLRIVEPGVSRDAPVVADIDAATKLADEPRPRAAGNSAERADRDDRRGEAEHAAAKAECAPATATEIP